MTDTELKVIAALAMDWTKQQSEEQVENAGRDRHTERVVDKSEEQVLPEVVCYTVAKRLTGTPGVLEVPVRDGGPSRTRTLDPLIKSHFEKDSIGHYRARSAAITRLKRVWPVSILRVA